MPKIDHIYIIHALQGYDQHEQRLREILPEFEIPFSFITQGDPVHFTDELIDKYFVSNIKDRLSTGVLSCTLNHILAYEDMKKNGYEYCLFLENDPFFCSGFRPKVDRVLKEALSLKPGFILSLENTTLRFPPKRLIRKEKTLYPADSGRAAGAYIMDKVGLYNILQDLQSNKCNIVIDWWHNDMISRGIVDMYWVHPTLTEQGSHNGQLNAGISSKKKSWWRQISWKIQKFYKEKLLYNIR